jgi:DedD protein
VQANIKQRVLGFVVLIAIAILFLPMIFDGDNGRNIAYQTTPKIPTRDIEVGNIEMPITDKILSATHTNIELKNNALSEVDEKNSISSRDRGNDKNTEQNEVSNATLGEAKNIVAADSNQSDESELVEKNNKTQKEESKDGDLLNEATNESKTFAFDTWVIQVGSFSDRQNAKRLQEKLRNENFKVFIRTQKSLGRLVNVVFVGQFKTKESADKEISKVEKVSGLKVFILPFEAVTKSLQ